MTIVDRQDKRKSGVYYYGVDFLRFFSAVFVLIYHLGYSTWFNQGGTFSGAITNVSTPDFFRSWAWFGWIGVEVFFVISGFVICQSASRYDFVSFLRSRVVRLFPAVWIIAPISFAAAIGLGVYGVAEGLWLTLKTMTLFPLYPWIDPVYWTLAVEVVFYALVSLFVLAGRWEWIYRWAVIVSVACFVFNTVAIYSVVYANGETTLGLPLQVLRLGFLSYGAFFAVGIFLWYLSSNRAFSPTLLSFSILACVLEIVVHVLYVGEKGGEGKSVIDAILPATFFLTVLAYFYMAIQWSDIFSRMRPMLRSLARRVGRMTYPLYLLHFTIGVYFMRLLVDYGLEGELVVVAASLLVVILSFVVSEYLEPRLASRVRVLYDFLLIFFRKA